MKSQLTSLIIGIFQTFVAPNVLIVGILTASVVYYQTSVNGSSPTWERLAEGSIAVIGVLSAFTVRMFMLAVAKWEKQAEDDRIKRDEQHNQNRWAIVELARASGNQEKIDQIISDYLKAQT